MKYEVKQQCTAVANEGICITLFFLMMTLMSVSESVSTPKATMNGAAQSTPSSDLSMSMDSPCSTSTKRMLYITA